MANHDECYTQAANENDFRLVYPAKIYQAWGVVVGVPT
jgi:hypothetical protein